ncbi:MAG: RNA pyrophosphohydrolase [Micavibrio sp.]|nr:MAG: RNA pyrophosphohydrolase [Micavibrio sp.]
MTDLDNREDAHYRSGVGLMIRNSTGLIFMGERADNPGHFQMPQGGIDAGENPEDAVFRELYEETGMTAAVIRAEAPEWLYYDFPDAWRARLFDGRYRGQRQKWFLLDFSGNDAEIDLNADETVEFSSYKWVRSDDIVPMAVDFKKTTYRRVLLFFEGYV